MTAKLDAELIRKIAKDFPKKGAWEKMQCNECLPNEAKKRVSFSHFKRLEDVGGIYAVFLPVNYFDRPRTIQLHASLGTQIPFQFTLSDDVVADYALVYIGRTSRLGKRWKTHLSSEISKTGGQVQQALRESGVVSKTAGSARAFLRQHGLIYYHKLSGPVNCANRDMIEIALCAKYMAPFNIKAER